MKFLLSLALLLFVAAAQAVMPRSEWAAQCTHGGKPFQLSFKSQSGDVFEDDMQVFIVTTKGGTRKLPFKPALYVSSQAVTSIQNSCSLNSSVNGAGVFAYSVTKTSVLFFISQDYRPTLNRLVLALINVETGELLHLLETGREIKSVDGVLFLKDENKKRYVRLVNEHLKNTGTDSIENYIESWVEITVIANKISIKY
jgi:hypothetical protein